MVFSVQNSVSGVQTAQIRTTTPMAATGTTQVRIVSPAIARPGQPIQQRLLTPLRGATVGQPPRVITTTRTQGPTVVSQPPALHPVFPQSKTINVVRPQVSTIHSPSLHPYSEIFCEIKLYRAFQNKDISFSLKIIFFRWVK